MHRARAAGHPPRGGPDGPSGRAGRARRAGTGETPYLVYPISEVMLMASLIHPGMVMVMKMPPPRHHTSRASEQRTRVQIVQ